MGRSTPLDIRMTSTYADACGAASAISEASRCPIEIGG